jgi:hypothetical protein
MAAGPADLAPVPRFASLSEEELDELASRFEVKAAGEGVRLAGEGASGDPFFVLVEGRADRGSGASG